MGIMFTSALICQLLVLPLKTAAPVIWCKPAEIARFLQRNQDQLSIICPQYIDQTAIERITIPSIEAKTVNDIVYALDDARIAARNPASEETREDLEGEDFGDGEDFEDGDDEHPLSDLEFPSSVVAAACGCLHSYIMSDEDDTR
ncbi:hypothetical protein V8F20_012745 [Naviculisporaceae sp. PSN 640]